MKKLITTFLFMSVPLIGCQDDPKNMDECIQIEEARCDLQRKCDSNFDVSTCEAYAKEHCRTREIKGDGADWSKTDVTECAEAIAQIACDDPIPSGDALLIDKDIDETNYLDECYFIHTDDVDTGSESEQTDTGSEETDTGLDTDTSTS